MHSPDTFHQAHFGGHFGAQGHLQMQNGALWAAQHAPNYGDGPMTQAPYLSSDATQSRVMAPRFNLVPKVPIYMGNDLTPIRASMPMSQQNVPILKNSSLLQNRPKMADRQRWLPPLQAMLQRALPSQLQSILPPQKERIPAASLTLGLGPIQQSEADEHLKAADKILDSLAEETVRSCRVEQKKVELDTKSKEDISSDVKSQHRKRSCPKAQSSTKPQHVPTLNLSAIEAGAHGRQDKVHDQHVARSVNPNSQSSVQPSVIHENDMQKWQIPLSQTTSSPTMKDDLECEDSPDHGCVLQQKNENSRLAILPGGMYARVNEIYIEEGHGNTIGRNLYAIPLKKILQRLDVLEREYQRLRRENVSLKEKVWTFYTHKRNGQIDCLQLPPDPELIQRASLQGRIMDAEEAICQFQNKGHTLGTTNFAAGKVYRSHTTGIQ